MTIWRDYLCAVVVEAVSERKPAEQREGDDEDVGQHRMWSAQHDLPARRTSSLPAVWGRWDSAYRRPLARR